MVAREANTDYEVISKSIRRNINIAVHAVHTEDEGRKVVEIAEIRDLKIVPLFAWDFDSCRFVENTDYINSSIVKAQLGRYRIETDFFAS